MIISTEEDKVGRTRREREETLSGGEWGNPWAHHSLVLLLHSSYSILRRNQLE